MPTTINNVETLCNIPHLINNGLDWYKAMGPERSTGTKILSVSGHVRKPGNYEIVMGTPLRDLIYDICGGIPGDFAVGPPDWRQYSRSHRLSAGKSAREARRTG